MKYLGTHALIHLLSALYYAVCGWRVPLPLLIVTAAIHLLVTISLLVLGCRDPGSLPKIFAEYERE